MLYKFIKRCEKKGEFDLASNLLVRKIPPGKTIEIINVKALKKILNNTKSKHDLEHLTTYIYKNKKKFNLIKLKEPANFKFKYSYAIDNFDDLERSKYIAKKVRNLANLSNQEIFCVAARYYLQKQSINS